MYQLTPELVHAHHICTISVPSLYYICTILVPYLYHICTISVLYLYHLCYLSVSTFIYIYLYDSSSRIILQSPNPSLRIWHDYEYALLVVDFASSICLGPSSPLHLSGNCCFDSILRSPSWSSPPPPTCSLAVIPFSHSQKERHKSCISFIFLTSATISSWPSTELPVPWKPAPSNLPTMPTGHPSPPMPSSSPSFPSRYAASFCRRPSRAASSASPLPWSAVAHSKCWATLAG